MEDDGLMYLQARCSDNSTNCYTVGLFATVRFELNDDAKAGKYFLTGSYSKKQIIDKDAEYVAAEMSDGSIRVRTVAFPESAEVYTEGEAGETVFVPVTIDSETDVLSMDVDVDFDEENLLFVDAMTPEVEDCEIKVSEDGKQISITSEDFGKAIKGKITTILEFQIAKDAVAAEYAIEPSYEEDAVLSTIGGSINQAMLGVSGGVVKVTATTTIGDANGDGVVNMKDVLAVRKFVAGIAVGGFNEAAAVVNKDGAVNMKDVLMVRKFIAGLVTELG